MSRGNHTNHLAGPSHPRWGNGHRITKDGYGVLRVGREHPLANCRGEAYEHDIIFAAALGAPEFIKRKILIHHHNEIRNDNRFDNLRPKTRPEHNHIHVPRQPRDNKGRWITSI